jgi:WSC domain
VLSCSLTVLSVDKLSGQCYCGNILPNDSYNASSTDCNMACTGDDNEVCGGSDRLTLFWNGKNETTATSFSSTTSSSTLSTSSSPSSVAPPVGWTFLGCYTDNTDNRTFLSSYFPSLMTIEVCTSICLSHDFTLAGVEV